MGDHVLKKTEKMERPLAKNQCNNTSKPLLTFTLNIAETTAPSPKPKCVVLLLLHFQTHNQEKRQKKNVILLKIVVMTLWATVTMKMITKEQVDIFLRTRIMQSIVDRLCFVLGHSILGRSQTTLGIQFADLYSMKMPQVGITQSLLWLLP